MKIEEDDLLKQARIRFKEGTKFKSIFSDNGLERIVERRDTYTPVGFQYYKDGTIGLYPGIKSEYGCSNPTIYRDGKWCPTEEYDLDLEEALKIIYND